jgi:hypothetical protein
MGQLHVTLFVGGTCQCDEWYSGVHCEVQDPCESVDCGDHGNCVGVSEGITRCFPAWMLTSDECHGFRESINLKGMFFAVSRNTTWDLARTYSCPEGYHWATSSEVDNSLDGSVDSTDSTSMDNDHYYNQCGWSGYIWEGGKRSGFRLADSCETRRCVHVGQRALGDGHCSMCPSCAMNADDPTPEFAGIVCAAD